MSTPLIEPYDPLCREQATRRSHIERLIRLVKSFQGDVYGDALRHCSSLFGETSAAVPVHLRSPPIAANAIRCRISPEYVMLFLSVLRVDYSVQRQDDGSYSLFASGFGLLPLTLHITIMSRREWGLTAADFDIDMLAMDALRVYVRNGATLRLCHAQDVFDYLMTRLRRGRFCLTDAGRTLLHNQRAMKRAYALVHAGWVMDDVVLGCKRGWALTRLPEATAACMTEEERMCALCHECFKPDEIVSKLSCGHVFHYVCGTTSAPCGAETGNCESVKTHSGLFTWLEHSCANTCPYCRAVI